MYLLDKKGRIRIYSAREPKFTSHRGETWESLTTRINNEKTTFHYNSSWGRNFYFQINKKWFLIPIKNIDRIKSNNHFILTKL